MSTSNRLSARPGEWIDRSKPVRFTFEGRDYTGFAGDTISSALHANGVRLLGRSFKYHRPRGIFSFANHDINAMVEDGADTNIRGDVTPIREGAHYHAVNTFGGLRSDWGRYLDWFGRFLPVGFYYKTFHRPRAMFPFFEKRIRAMAGLGAINPKAPRLRTPKSYDFCDVLVIGSGAAGLTAGITAARHGARVVVVDENRRPGGSLTYRAEHAPTLAKLLAEAKSLPTIDIRPLTVAAGCYADHWVALVNDERLVKMRAKSVVIASGCFEQPALFRNNDLPGIMLASGAQRLIAQFALKPFSRAVVLTANAEGYRAALDLRDAGVEIVAIVDLRTGSEAAAQGAAARAAGIVIVPGSTIYAAKPASGKVGITGVIIRTVDGSPAGERRIACDGVAMSVGWAPSDGLICQVGGKMAYSDPIQQFVPEVMPAGMFAAGRINGFHALDAKLADGARAGDAAAAHAGLFKGPVAKIAERIGPSPTHPLACLSHPDGKVFVDLDEDVQLKDLENAAQEGFDSVELLKRYSTFGMGPSQGKHSNTNTIRVLAKIRGQTMGEIGAPRSRPFYHPITFGHLGGRGFHPHRHTALHQRHVDAHAVFMLAGEWQRPAYYAAPGTTRESAISQEARAVRHSLGIIDVGTLGKIEVSGAAAGEFIERIYTGRFAKMKVGTTRYGLMCDESGVIIDDGVIARLAEDRYYVTTTTTASASVYREMQRWALIWGLEVVLVNATGTYAAMNLAGPQSRAVLATLTGQDLTEAAFPYLGAREALVAGVPARLMRVGFVGELGYEIHVPACSGAHVWDALIAAGAKAAIRPFGVEAQRILRLEKGHAIISQDTDGLSTPRDAQMEWAVKMDKPFFIGQRSLAIVAEKTAKRTLIGFTLSPHHRGLVPQECHLVVDGRTICGRVTSIVASPTLGHVIGMAYVTPAQAKPGTVIHIRMDSGHLVEATVSATPFYDPKNLRQTEGGPAKAEAPAAPQTAAATSMANAGKT